MNIKKYYLYNVFNDLMPIYPLYLLMFESRGLTLFQISLLLSIWSVPAIIMEIPTGILADRWSRKNMLAVGELLKSLCFVFWMFSDGFAMYAVGFVLWGLGGAFQSGAEEAWLYDSLKMQKLEYRFDQVLGKGRFISGLSKMAAAIGGGFVGEFCGYHVALGLSITAGLITAGIVYSMKEVNLYKEYLQNQRDTRKGTSLKHAMSFLLRQKQLFLLVLLAVFVITTADTLDEYDQVIAKDYGLSLSMIGIWSAIRFIMISLGGYLACGLRIAVEKLLRKKDGLYTIGFLSLIAAICMLFAGSIHKISIMILYGLFYFIMSAGEVLQEDYVQQRINNEGRATVHSILSLSRNLYGILFFSLFGITATGSGLHVGLMWVGLYIAIWTIVILIIYLLKKRRWYDIS